MMSLAVDTPWVLSGLLLTLLPLFNSGMRPSPTPWLSLMPADTLSVFIVCCLRLCAMAAITGVVLGMAGLHRTEQSRERIGHGAHIVLLLDRSSSMDNSFAGRAPNGSDEGRDAGGTTPRMGEVEQRMEQLPKNPRPQRRGAY